MVKKRKPPELGFDRSVHGNAAGRLVPILDGAEVARVELDDEPRVEVPPFDEMARGRAAPDAEAQRGEDAAPPEPRADINRTAQGRLADPGAARKLAELSALARRAKAERMAVLPRLLRDLKVQGVAPGDFDLDAIDELVEHEAARLEREFAAGELPDVVRGILQTVGFQQQASRLKFAAGDLAEASRLGNDARQNILAAHAVAAKSAEARGVSPSYPDATTRQGDVERTESVDVLGRRVVVERRELGVDEVGKKLFHERRTTTNAVTGEVIIFDSAIASMFRGISRDNNLPARRVPLDLSKFPALARVPIVDEEGGDGPAESRASEPAPARTLTIETEEERAIPERSVAVMLARAISPTKGR